VVLAVVKTRKEEGMTELQVGQRIKDNDPRVAGRTLIIASMDNGYVTATNVRGQPVRILRNRIYTDDKQRRTGFSVIAALGVAPSHGGQQ
jgi:hypothetical protein